MWQNIPDRLTYKIESIQEKGYAHHFSFNELQLGIKRSLYTITISDLVLAVSRVLLVELSARKSLSLISASSGHLVACTDLYVI